MCRSRRRPSIEDGGTRGRLAARAGSTLQIRGRWTRRGRRTWGTTIVREPIKGANGGRFVDLRRPGDAEVGADFLERLDDSWVERNPFFSEFLHADEALFAVHIDPLLPLGLRAVLQFSGEAVDVPAELVERTERARVQGEAEVADIGPSLVRVDLQSRRGATEDAAQDVDQEREAVSFVAAEVLAFSAEGGEASAEA